MVKTNETETTRLSFGSAQSDQRSTRSGNSYDSERMDKHKCTHRAFEDLMPYFGNREFHKDFLEAVDVLTHEPPVSTDGEPLHFKPIEGLELAYSFVCQKYISYVKLLKALNQSLRRLMHPQKKILFKKFIEGVAIRVVELKCEMTTLVHTTTHNLTGVLADLGLTPDDLVYDIPETMLEDSYPIMQQREKFLSVMLTALDTHPACDVDSLIAITKTEQIRTEEAITNDTEKFTKVMLPNNHQKGRSSIRWSKSMALVKVLDGMSFHRTSSKPLTQEMHDFVHTRRYKEWLQDPSFHKKVKLIQNCLRSWIGRRGGHEVFHKVGFFLNMIPGQAHHETKRDQASQKLFGTLMEQRKLDYEKALDNDRGAYPSSAEADYERWQLKQNLTQWVLELRDLLGNRPLYPEPEIGGCSVLFTNKTVDEVEDDLIELSENEKKTSSKNGKDKGKEKDKDKGGKEKKKDAAKESKGKKDKNAPFEWTMPRTLAVPGLVDALKEYGGYWFMKEEFDNIPQRHDLQVMREKVRVEAESTIREAIDALMEHELERIRAVDREPPPKPNKNKGKKDKRSGGKGKGKKDPLNGYDIDDLYAAFVIEKIIIRPKEASLSDLVCCPNMNGETRFTSRITTQQDMQMALRELYGIPLLSNTLHSNMPLHNSVLLAGPDGVGKLHMVHALARETRATLIDLSPVNMVGKYQGKKFESFLMNGLLKMGKLREPTIFLVDECHLLFNKKNARKRPYVDKDKPARWSKMLTKLMKKLKPGDRMLLIGCTSEPFYAKTGPMCKLFKDVYLIPYPDHGTRFMIWQHYLDKIALARPADVNISVLAKMSEGLTGGDIKDIVDKVLTTERQVCLAHLRNKEFISHLSKTLPGEDTPDAEDWIEWFETTPLVKARKEMLRTLEEQEEAAAQAMAKKR